MGDEHREMYSQTLQVLQNKFEIVVSLLKSLVKPESGDEDGVSSTSCKVSRLRYVGKKGSLDEAIGELETWQGLADNSWFLLLRIADKQVDEALSLRGGNNEPSTRTAMPVTIAIRASLQQADDQARRPSAVEHIFLNSNDLKSMTISAISYCDGIAMATRSHSNRTESRYILNHIKCDPGAKPQILKCNVHDLVRKLQVDEPHTFGLLKCKGFVAESVPAGHAEHMSLTLVFREPPASDSPRSLRDVLINTSASTSTTQRLDIARDLARSVGYVHTFGFVHKNVCPESVLIFDRADGQGISAFLVGFENFRRVEGWTRRQGDDAPDKNLYRHASRQSFNPLEDYEMRHDIYSLGVCLLEIGLWGSFVDYDPATGTHSISQLLLSSSSKSTFPFSPLFPERTKEQLVTLARYRLPGSMGDKYAEIVETCLTCLDAGNVDFGDDREFEDEDGIRVGARYIGKVSTKTGIRLYTR
jgi:hypothetical protein